MSLPFSEALEIDSKYLMISCEKQKYTIKTFQCMHEVQLMNQYEN